MTSVSPSDSFQVADKQYKLITEEKQCRFTVQIQASAPALLLGLKDKKIHPTQNPKNKSQNEEKTAK